MARIDWLAVSDDELAEQCEEDRYRASGPGGQKRNKIDSAIRLRHQPTGLIVTATESRSQHENRRRALRRLREALAFEWRQRFEEPADVPEIGSAPSLKIGERDPNYLPTAALVLDLLDSQQARLSNVAEMLAVSTGQLVSFLESSPKLWQAAQRLRQAYGQKPLKASK